MSAADETANFIGEKAPESGSKQKRPIEAWRKTVFVGTVVACLVLAANVGLLIWAVRKHERLADGTVKVFEGNCDDSESGTVWPELGINILSTLLLSASNNCAQLLSSPTRDDIDKAHAKGNWLDIGVPSTKNVFHISYWRSLLWTLLFLSSIPLHLVYNSVLFRTQAAVEYQATLVTEAFIESGQWNASMYDGSHGVIELMKASVLAGNLTRLDNSECIQAYKDPLALSGFKNLLLVTSNHVQGNIAHAWAPDLTNFADASWIYTASTQYCSVPHNPECKPAKDIEASKWTMWIQKPYDSSDQRDEIPISISYCLAEPFSPRCTIRVSVTLLAVVILSNTIKVCCLISTLFVRGFRPLATIGDAIASFLECPDPTTAEIGPISFASLRSQRVDSGKPYTSTPFQRKAQPWVRAVKPIRWPLCIILYLTMWLIAFFPFLDTWRRPGFLSKGFGDNFRNLVDITLGHSLIGAVLITNTPQILVSFLYLFYNHLITTMVLAHEYGHFASVRKPLRVSQPSGQQRSTLWLQLPYRYSIPLMTCTALLHWAISRSLYLVQLVIYDAYDRENRGSNISGCAYGDSALLLTLCLGAAMIITLVVLPYRKLDSGMPVAGSCSLAISATTHAHDDEHDIATLPLQYGALAGARVDAYGRERAGFSSRPVEPLVDGKHYI